MQQEIVEEVIQWLSEAPDKEVEEFINSSREGLIVYHSTLGRDIRNHFKLWRYPWKPELDDQGVDVSPYHPDQVSMQIITKVWETVQKRLVK